LQKTGSNRRAAAKRLSSNRLEEVLCKRSGVGTAVSAPSRLRMLWIRIFPSVLSGARPIVSPSLFSQSWAMKIAPSLRLDSAARLILLRQLDPLRKWESLDDRRFCRCCHKFISGRQIEVTSASGKPLRVVCPTIDCSSTVRDWVYPNEIAQSPDTWGRRV